MSLCKYKLGLKIVGSEDVALKSELAECYKNKVRPLCMCKPPSGVAMYIARIENGHIIKRMPNTGAMHTVNCAHFEPPQEISGLGHVSGYAIQEDSETGEVNLKFDFALTKIEGRAAPVATGSSVSDSVTSDATKLTLRGTLHYLWGEAGFNKWSPSMENKRNWAVIRRYLLESAGNKNSKKQRLIEMIYIPETFLLDKKDQIVRDRTLRFSRISSSSGSQRILMIAIGELKSIDVARYGFKLMLKHLPDFGFFMNQKMHDQLQKRFKSEFELWNALDKSHLMVILTFGLNDSGFAYIEELSLMLVDENWIPVESKEEYDLCNQLVGNKRHFQKCLKYNLGHDRPIASFVVTDTEPKATAMYIVPMFSDDDYLASLDGLVDESDLNSWMWMSGEVMPSIPDKHRLTDTDSLS